MIEFTCDCGKISTSEVERISNETKFHFIVECYCQHCGKLVTVKVAKIDIPNRRHDEPPKA